MIKSLYSSVVDFIKIKLGLFEIITFLLVALGITVCFVGYSNNYISETVFNSILVGMAAQLVDGALGMAYGVTAGTLLMASGISPVYSSASIHASEIFTSGISGFMHLKFGNVNKKLLKTLIVPGAIGAVLGALSLVYLGEIAKRFLVPLVSVYTFVLGILILKKALGKKVKKERIGKVGWLASFGGYMDAVGGGGWGPIVSSTLIAKGRDPVFTIGSVNLAEFFVSISSAFTFAFVLGMAHIDVTGGLIVGGALTAPIAAKIFKSIPVKLMMIMVSLLILGLSLRQIIKTLITLL